MRLHIVIICLLMMTIPVFGQESVQQPCTDCTSYTITLSQPPSGVLMGYQPQDPVDWKAVQEGRAVPWAYPGWKEPDEIKENERERYQREIDELLKALGEIQDENKELYKQIQEQNDEAFQLRRALEEERKASALDAQEIDSMRKSLIQSQELNSKLIDQLSRKTSPFKAFFSGMGVMGAMLSILHAIW